MHYFYYFSQKTNLNHLNYNEWHSNSKFKFNLQLFNLKLNNSHEKLFRQETSEPSTSIAEDIWKVPSFTMSFGRELNSTTRQLTSTSTNTSASTNQHPCWKMLTSCMQVGWMQWIFSNCYYYKIF